MVLVGLVTAWRLASWPTRRSPVLVNATTDGTVRPPSADAITVGSPPSMTATTEFVVPRSIPMILPMLVVSPRGVLACFRLGKSVDPWGGFAAVGARCDGHPGRAQDSIANAVAALELGHDAAFGELAAGDVDQGLVQAW